MKIVQAISSVTLDNYTSLPGPMVRFLEMFIGRIGNILGINFYIEPLAETGIPLDLQIKLEYLKSKSIVESYSYVSRFYNDEPQIFGAQVTISGKKRMGYSGFGRSLLNQSEVWGPAYGEALERWCLDHYAPTEDKTRMLNTKQLRDLSGIDLSKTPGIESNLRLKAKYHIDDTSEFVCVDSVELTTTKRLPTPLQWFSFYHAEKYIHSNREPQIYPLITTGSAAGETLEKALIGGIYENIERDAFMIYWMRKITPKKIDHRKLKGDVFEKITQMCDRYNLEPHFLYLQTDIPVNVIACVLIDRSGVGPAVAVDANAGSSIEKCIEKSFLGALGLRPLFRNQIKKSAPEQSTEKLTLEKRGLWWFSKDKLPLIEFLLQGNYIENISETPTRTTKEELDYLVAIFKKMKYQIFYQNILPKTLADATSTSVVSVKIPQLQPLHLNEWERCSEGERLRQVPEMMKLECGSDTINPLPHPFA